MPVSDLFDVFYWVFWKAVKEITSEFLLVGSKCDMMFGPTVKHFGIPYWNMHETKIGSNWSTIYYTRYFR